MADSNSSEYYQAREDRERTLAAAATDPAIANIHLDMAERYSRLLLEPSRRASRIAAATFHTDASEIRAE